MDEQKVNVEDSATEQKVNVEESATKETSNEQENGGHLFIEQSIVDILPTMVKSSLSKMSQEKQSMFVEEYNRKKKSVGLAYFFLIICLGMPYGYLGKWGLQIVYWITGCGCLIWFIYLLFTLPKLVKSYNQDVAAQIVRDMQIIG